MSIPHPILRTKISSFIQTYSTIAPIHFQAPQDSYAAVRSSLTAALIAIHFQLYVVISIMRSHLCSTHSNSTFAYEAPIGCWS
jgi:hypothetical protein